MNESLEFMAILVAIALVMALIVMPLNRISLWGIESERNALQSSINNARQIQNNIEVAAITMQIAKFNGDLASLQYYDSLPIIGWYIPDNVSKLQPIQ